MKYLISTFLLAFLTYPVFSQLEYDFKIEENGSVYFDDVIEVEGETKDELYLKAKDWFHDIFDIDVGVVTFLDPDNGKIKGDARTKNLVYKNTGVKKNGGHIEYKISLLFLSLIHISEPTRPY